MIEELIANYNLLGSVLSLAGIVVVTKLGKYLLFKVPAMAETKQLNREQDKL